MIDTNRLGEIEANVNCWAKDGRQMDALALIAEVKRLRLWLVYIQTCGDHAYSMAAVMALRGDEYKTEGGRK